jgi:hypothetical protein
VEPGFSPLDEQLGLLPSHFSPYVVQRHPQAGPRRLGTLLPFEQVPEQLDFQVAVGVSVETVRRLTESAGMAQVAVEDEEVRQIQRGTIPLGDGPSMQQVSADGAMVPLVKGQWAEVTTLVVGTVEPGAPTEAVHTTPVAYCSRLSSADPFIETATRILHRCGTEQAGTVVAVMDGAGWLQQLIDGHRPGTRLRVSVRILDFPHAAGYLCQAAQAAYGIGSQETSTWLDTWLHELKHGHPDVVLAALRQLPTPTSEAAASRATVLRYLTARRDQIEYASFQASGYPIGSGMVESANKLLVEARLKGSGMSTPSRSGARRNVNPMVALRALICMGAWTQAWPHIWQHLRDQVTQRRRQRRPARCTADVPSSPPPPAEPAARRAATSHPATVVNGHPTSDRPWAHGYDQRLLARTCAKQ